jgi:hypothetical protein
MRSVILGCNRHCTRTITDNIGQLFVVAFDVLDATDDGEHKLDPVS